MEVKDPEPIAPPRRRRAQGVPDSARRAPGRGRRVPEPPPARAPRPQGPAPSRRSDRPRRRLRLRLPARVDIATVVHVLTLLAAAGFLFWLNRGQWFASDDFDFVASRGVVGDPQLGLFVPHNEHWSTVPILVWRAIFSLVGLRSYTPYIALVVLIHLGIAHLLWRTARATGAAAWPATALAGLFLVLGAGYENLLWAFQSAFLGSVLLGLVQVRLVTAGDDPRIGRRDLLGVLAAVAAVATSGVGVTMVAVAGLAALLRRGWRAAAVAVGPAAVVYLLWLALAGRSGLGVAPVTTEVWRLPGYIWAGMVAALAGVVGARLVAGLLAVVLLVACVWWVRTDRVRSAAAVALAAGPVVFFAITGLGRLSVYPDPDSSRYVYIGAALLLPVLARGLTALLSGVPKPVAVAVPVVLAVVLAVPGVGLLVAEAARYAAVEQAWRDRVIAAAQVFRTYPEQVVHHGVTSDLGLDELMRMAEEGNLPDAEPSRRAVAEARLLLGVGQSDGPGPDGDPPVLVGFAQASATADGSGCVDVRPTGRTPQMAILVEEPTAVVITPPPGARPNIPVDSTDLSATRPRPLDPHAGRPTTIPLGVPGDITLTLPRTGTTRICGLATGP